MKHEGLTPIFEKTPKDATEPTYVGWVTEIIEGGKAVMIQLTKPATMTTQNGISTLLPVGHLVRIPLDLYKGLTVNPRLESALADRSTFLTTLGKPCKKHNTFPEPDEPCWACEREAQEVLDRSV